MITVWLILSWKYVNWVSYLLRAWLDVAASSRATTDMQWLSSSSMSTPGDVSVMDAVCSVFSSGSLCCWSLPWLLLYPVLLVALYLLGNWLQPLLDVATLPSSPTMTSTVLHGFPKPDKWASGLNSDLLKKQALRLLTLVGWTPRPTTLQEIWLELTNALRVACLINFITNHWKRSRPADRQIKI